VVAVVKGIRGIAVVVFILCPFRSRALILTFVGSVVVFLFCHWLLTTLDETYIDKNIKNGYWPQKPIDWTSSATTDKQQRTPNDKRWQQKKSWHRVNWRRANSRPEAGSLHPMAIEVGCFSATKSAVF
jgi:hypothetical protein